MKGLEKFNELVQSFASLPTIGRKTAMRLAYHICVKNTLEGMKLAHNIDNAVRFIKLCKQCGALSENELCEICSDENRNQKLLCIVEDPKDVLIIEESGIFEGFYFVLDALNEEKINRLKSHIKSLKSEEIIFALTHSLGSDATIFFIEDQLKEWKLKFSKIAQGIPSGMKLENVDYLSLCQALNFRTSIH